MNLIQNIKTLLTKPDLAVDFLRYQTSCLKNSGHAIQVLDKAIKISGLSGFSEFHSCKNFVNVQEKNFFQNYDFGDGDIIDIGANLGIVSLLLAKRHNRPKVHSFEANPFTFKALIENINLNECKNILPENHAIADYDGEIAFNANPVYRGTTSITYANDTHTVKVPCITLDSYIKQKSISEIALLKVDVEGYEELVFQGAKTLLSQRKIKIVYYEICPEIVKKANLSPYTPTNMLMDYGYNLYQLSDYGSLIPIEVSEIENVTCSNWIAIP